MEVESADAATMTCGRGATSAESNALYFGPAGARNVQRTLQQLRRPAQTFRDAETLQLTRALVTIENRFIFDRFLIYVGVLISYLF